MVVSDHTAASSLTWPTVVFNFFVTFWICLVCLSNLSNICLNSFSLPVPLTAVETWLLRFSRIADRAWPFVTVSRLFQKRLNLIKKMQCCERSLSKLESGPWNLDSGNSRIGKRPHTENRNGGKKWWIFTQLWGGQVNIYHADCLALNTHWLICSHGKQKKKEEI